MARSGAFTNYREVSLRLLLPAGRYCLIPSTYKENLEGQFILRVLQERDWTTAVARPVFDGNKLDYVKVNSGRRKSKSSSSSGSSDDDSVFEKDQQQQVTTASGEIVTVTVSRRKIG